MDDLSVKQIAKAVAKELKESAPNLQEDKHGTAFEVYQWVKDVETELDFPVEVSVLCYGGAWRLRLTLWRGGLQSMEEAVHVTESLSYAEGYEHNRADVRGHIFNRALFKAKKILEKNDEEA